MPASGNRKAIAEKDQHHEIEQDGCEGRCGETAIGVERARMQRDEGDEQQVGKGDLRHRDGEPQLFRIGIEARRQELDELRREQPGERQKQHLRGEKQGENLARKALGRGSAFAFEHARIGGHIGGVEGAFAENRAEMVGQTEGDIEGIGEHARAQHGAERHVAEKPGCPRQQGEKADREQILVHRAIIAEDFGKGRTPLTRAPAAAIAGVPHLRQISIGSRALSGG